MSLDKTSKVEKQRPKLLLMGYNGANNTGSEARLLAIIDDVRSVLGQEAIITVPSLNPQNLKRYLHEAPNQRIAPVPTIYFFAIRKLVKQHDLVLLVEGSCYMDTWTSALLWAFLWTSKYAYKYGKPCLAYAVDAGKLSTSNQKRVRREASKTDLIITRTHIAAKRLKDIGVTAPIEVTADTAFTFKMNKDDEHITRTLWPEAKESLVGLSVLDFYIWPVVVRLWGKKGHCYKWPYYFSRSRDKCQASEELANGWAREADRIIKKYDKNIALICMEELDEPIAKKILGKMKYKKRARIFSSKRYNASQMTGILRQLDMLVTSRYHAAVLSLEAKIPQIAVGHDPRLGSFYEELGIYDEYFISHNSPNLWNTLSDRVDKLLTRPDLLNESLNNGFSDHIKRAENNHQIFKGFVIENGWGVKT